MYCSTHVPDIMHRSNSTPVSSKSYAKYIQSLLFKTAAVHLAMKDEETTI